MKEEIDENTALTAWLRFPRNDTEVTQVRQHLVQGVWRRGYIHTDELPRFLDDKRNADHTMELAKTLYNHRVSPDMCASLIWVGAALGRTDAVLFMAYILARESEREKPERDPAYLNALSARWLRRLNYAVSETGWSIAKAHRALSAPNSPDDAACGTAITRTVHTPDPRAGHTPFAPRTSLGAISTPSARASRRWGRTALPDTSAAKRGKAEDQNESSQGSPVESTPIHAAFVCPAIGDATSRDAQEVVNRYRRIIGAPLMFQGKYPDPEKITVEMAAAFPWAEPAARELGECFSSLPKAGRAGLRLPPFLLVGPSGSGKAWMLEWLCRRLDLEFQTITCGGLAGPDSLDAIPRGMPSPRASAPVEAMAKQFCANPVVVINDLGKGATPVSGNGPLMATLAAMLRDRETYFDPCLLAPVDLSYVSFLASTNNLASIPPGLRKRFAVVEVPRPREEHFQQALSGVRAREAQRLALPPEALPWLLPHDLANLQKAFVASGCSLRSLEQAFRAALEARAAEESAAAKRRH